MARFIGTLKGNRGEASRLGSKKSGIKATVNGWHMGAYIVAYVNDDDKDCMDIYETTGSGGNFSEKLVKTIIEE